MTVENWPDYLKGMDGKLGKLRPEVPEIMKGFGAIAKSAISEGALDSKTKELMALAVGIAARCDGCLGYHTKAAIKYGATREEITETIGVAIYMGGGPSLMYGAEALAAFDAFSKQQANETL
ncbi:carboxymuconolactone decarboxylase family protein [Flexibacterium corallicola]|uniref:carboxymuconolactone decarboxylase family protein n=1 Tax=Flexibacterium corallicola TaxID=3037259 RepID=UPI00286ECD53|nr:carboxymuconolactone decarboxylase family protein [Pseudovibrio sp. M1P-2-3]